MSKETGNRPVSFSLSGGLSDRPIKVPCGQCVGCRLEYARQWAIRCWHEAQMHRDNMYLTLTYRDECLPSGGSLDHRDWQLFFKRFRRWSRSSGIKFLMCGEYGDLHCRPHFHAVVFGADVPDRVLFKTENGHALYSSAILEDIWSHGFTTVGDVTFESAGYVARYIMKKVKGPDADAHYASLGVKPEYTQASRAGGIGLSWLEKYWTDVYPSDFITVRGRKMRPPRFYDRWLRENHLDVWREVCAKRIEAYESREDAGSSRRDRVRERVRTARSSFLKRGLDEES